MQYFSGTASHNTVQFDDRDQMPRLGPFLFGAWPDCSELHLSRRPSYSVRRLSRLRGCMHRRMVELTENACVVRDEIADFRTKAVLRWRLAPASWAPQWHDGRIAPRRLSVTSATAPLSMTIDDGWESLHYGSRTRIPVLQVVFDRPPT